MSDDGDRPDTPAPLQTKPAEPRSEDERRVWEIVEQARQEVKPLAKKELEVEVVSSDLLNSRLRASEL